MVPLEGVSIWHRVIINQRLYSLAKGLRGYRSFVCFERNGSDDLTRGTCAVRGEVTGKIISYDNEPLRIQYSAVDFHLSHLADSGLCSDLLLVRM